MDPDARISTSHVRASRSVVVSLLYVRCFPKVFIKFTHFIKSKHSKYTLAVDGHGTRFRWPFLLFFILICRKTRPVDIGKVKKRTTHTKFSSSHVCIFSESDLSA